MYSPLPYMDPEKKPKVVATMGPFLTRFNGVHLNKILDIQGKDFNDLPTMHEHMDAKLFRQWLRQWLKLPPCGRKYVL